MIVSNPSRRPGILPVSVVVALAVAAVASPAGAVILDGVNKCTVKLSDGSDVDLWGEYISDIGGDKLPSSPVLRPQLGRRLSPIALERIRRFPLQPIAVARPPATSDRDKAIERARQIRAGWDAPTFKEHKKSNLYYYVPPNSALRLSTRPDGRTPEFLFVRYTTEDRADAGGTQGGILHMLMEWRLTSEQEKDLRQKVEQNCTASGKPGKLMGVIDLEEVSGKNGFEIRSATIGAEEFTKSVVQSGHAPTTPGGKVVAAANLNANGAQLFHSIAEKSKSISDLSVEITLGYPVQLPAAKGEIIFHWDRMQEQSEAFFGDYDRKSENFGPISGKTRYSEEEIETMFSTAVERGVVEFNFEGYRPDDEFSQQVMQAMLRFFTDSLMEPAREDLELPEQEARERPDLGEEKFLGNDDEFRVDSDALRSAFAAKKQIVYLNAGLAVPRQFTMVGNLAGWYGNVRGTGCCVFDVNLNDPFFEHRDIRFILDLDAKEIFEDMVNYVTINVRKKRDSGNTFERSMTIDQQFLKERGVAASLTYAREGDDDSGQYEYMTQWSVRGGNIYPARPRWLRGDWEGVTLAPPIERWRVEVEGDLDQMVANDIARVTVEMHYPLFGEEEFKVLALSPRAGEWVVSDHLYVDRGTRGFAYRLIVHHKTEGRLVLPWQTRIGDRYVYATLPEDILVAGSAREQAKAAAKQLGQMGAEKVLDRFSELFSNAD